MNANGRRITSRIAPLLATVLVQLACSRATDPGGPKPAAAARPPAPAPPTPRQEFEAHAAKILSGSNRYLGREPIRQVQARLASPALDPAQRYQALMTLVQLEVREGRTSESLARVDEAGRLLEELLPRMASDPAEALASYHQVRAIAFLRAAEQANCLAAHAADSCILPFRGAGVHHVPEPGREALRCWLEVLRHRPRDLDALWLLNVTAMALGQHPAAVPEGLRLDFAVHQARAGLPELLDVAPRLGLDTLSLAGGMVVEDLDGDGLLDVATSTSDPEGHLQYHRNRGDGTFEDLAAASGLDKQLGGLNMISADADADGDADLLVLRGGWQGEDGRIRMSLLRNDGHGRFEDVTHDAGLAGVPYPTQAAVFGDLDDDGDLDLFVGNEVRIDPDGRPVPFPSQLFRNDAGRFGDVASESGVANMLQAKGVTAGDYDNDGDLDLYVSNIGANRLYRNDGAMKFVDVAAQAGVVEPSGRSFAPWFFDYDNDGWLDLWVSAYDAKPGDLAADLLGLAPACGMPRLYRNNRDGTFTDAAKGAGLAHPYLPMGANFGDVDGDGWLDMYLGTGDPEFTTLMPNVMLWNDHGRRFLDVTAETRLGHLQKGHGIAFADIDNDGDQDIAHQLGGFVHGDRFHDALFLNPGRGSRFLYLRLVGTTANRSAIGARIEVEAETPSGTRIVHRAVGSVSSFGGSPLSRLEIGLGDASRIRQVRVWWPRSRRSQTFDDVPLDAMVEITEGRSDVVRMPLTKAPIEPAGGE